MKKYFIVPEVSMPLPIGSTFMTCAWTSIDLSSHGQAGEDWHLVAFEDAHFKPPADWVELPHVYETSAQLKDKIDHTLLADLGVTGEESTLQLTRILSDIHPLMGV